jgi:DNA-binding MarR family transcriptional regulator
MPEVHRQTAHALLDIIPGVMRAIALGLRRSKASMSPVHLRMLLELAERPHNLSELAERNEVSLPTMSNSITTLVDRGWVSRERDPDDRRMLLIGLTPIGRTVLSDIHQQAKDCLLAHLEGLNEGDCQRLLEGLGILARVFH